MHSAGWLAYNGAMAIRPLYRHQRVTVMGLGLFGGGAGAARFWSELGSDVVVTDLRDAETLAPSLKELEGLGCRFVLGEHRDEDFKNCDLVIANPAVKPDNQYLRLARSAGAHVLTEIGLVFRLASGPIIGVTGSNGKSTTTALLGQMLRAHEPRTLVGGNLGGSLLGALRRHLPSAPIILELSSFQLHYLRRQRVSPTVSVVTNLQPNHLDWHGTVLRYYEDKRTIVRFQTNDDAVVLNVEDPTLAAWAAACRGRVVHVARKDPGARNACFLDAEDRIVARLDQTECVLAPIDSLQLPGGHNVMNALLAAAAAYTFSRNAEAVGEGLAAFSGLPHRLEDVGTADGIRFVNDSIATTPQSTICALASFKEPKALIVGGHDKGLSFEDLGAAIRQHAHAAVLVGETATAIRDAIEADAAEPPRPPLFEAGSDFEQAVRLAKEACPAGGIVLLSPACSSHDMFNNFAERGEAFRRIVRELGARVR